MENNIFAAADILLPPYAPSSPDWEKWSVIACDQFTSEASYWEECEQITAGKNSTYNVILPEAYLGSDKEPIHKLKISSALRKYTPWLKKYGDSFVYVERTLPDGKIRRGIVGKIDLESYDYSKGSTSPVRATEATVLERIPPREKIRASADIELPHIMIFVAQESFAVFDAARRAAENTAPVYDFTLMQGGGALKGYIIPGGVLEGAISEYEKLREGGVAYAMGDGNHSLAAAKSHYEHIKAKIGEAALAHPSRYALAEIVSLADEAIEFEPIYRLVKTEDGEKFLDYIRSVSCDNGTPIRVISELGEFSVCIPEQDSHTAAGALQAALDEYVKIDPSAAVDYIHGEDSLKSLSAEKGTFGIIFDGLEKDDLIPYIEKWGTLPKKTFSMGEAKSKRYYTEARIIV